MGSIHSSFRQPQAVHADFPEAFYTACANLDEHSLWQRLRAWGFDDPTHPRPFSRRLMQAGDWPFRFTRRLIEEYRRFLFLAVILEGQVCPSEEIDLAWHTHLLASAHYFDEFCPQVLGRALHHYPATGNEGGRHTDHYARTLYAYECIFKAPAPRDIWPAASARFASSFYSVQRASHWVWRKPQWLRRLSGSLKAPSSALALLLTSASAQAATFDPNPAPGMDGPTFLKYFLAVFVLLIIVTLAARALQPDPDIDAIPMSLNPEDIGYLQGGAARAVYAALAQLLQQNCIAYDELGKVWRPMNPLSGLPTALMQSVHQQLDQGTDILNIIDNVQPQLDALHDRLYMGGFLRSPDRHRKHRTPLGMALLCLWWIFWIWAMLRALHGFIDGFPVMILAMSIFATFAVGGMMLGNFYRALTQRARNAIDLAKTRTSKHLERHDARLPLAVALFGLSAFAVTDAALAQALMPGARDSSSGGSGCSSSSCGGGGDGGGGCGGCGGGGD